MKKIFCFTGCMLASCLIGAGTILYALSRAAEKGYFDVEDEEVVE